MKPAIAGCPGPRERLGAAVFARVAGPDGPRNRARIHDTPGPRWFGPEQPVRRVHGDASMFIGGLSSLLLQSLHPLAMAAVSAHSGFRGDPWGRLQRTSTFPATTTYGTADQAQRACDQVRAVHERERAGGPANASTSVVVAPRSASHRANLARYASAPGRFRRCAATSSSYPPQPT